MRILFIHRSVGQQLIDAANPRDPKWGIEFWDINVNTAVLTDADGVVSRCPFEVPGNDTAPENLNLLFEAATNTDAIQSFLDGFDLVAFKSCYSANNLVTDEDLLSKMEIYRTGIATYIRSKPQQHFMIVSSPPRKPPLFTRGPKSERAKKYAGFLSELSGELDNTTFFDLFSTLSDGNGGLRRGFRRQLPWDQHPNDAGATAAGVAFCENIVRLKIE